MISEHVLEFSKSLKIYLDDFVKMFPDDIPSKMIWDEIQKEFGSTEHLVIAFGNKDKSILLNNKTKKFISHKDKSDVPSIEVTNYLDNSTTDSNIKDPEAPISITENDSNIDDIYHFILKFPKKVIANITIEILSRPKPTREMVIIGTEGKIIYNNLKVLKYV